MAGDTLWLNATAFFINLMGLVLLALASERPGELLLQRPPSRRQRLMWRALGWALLALTLGLCVQGWGWGIGAVAWLGWLCMAGVVLVFALPRRTEQSKKARPVPASPVQPAMRSRPWRMALALVLVGAPVAFAWGLYTTPVKPLLRADAVADHAGPWAFTLVETDRDPPELVVQDIPTKQFEVRFCETCDAHIRSAYLKVHKPRSLRGAGIVFSGSRWNRSVEIQLPSNTRADSELWLTVEGKDGSVHQTSVRIQDIAPTTARWFEARREK